MKRFVVFIMIIMNFLMISSCDSNDVAKKNAESTVISSENPNEEAIKDKAEGVEVDDDLYCKNKVYSIAPSELLNRDLDRPKDNSEWIKSLIIKYPQLYNMEDGEKQKRINDLIFKKVITCHNVLENRDYIEYFTDYKIMYSDDEIFSVLFTGEVSDYRTSNKFAFGITINIEDGDEMPLENMFVVDDSFVENYLFSKFDVIENNFEDVQENIPYVEQFVETYSSNSHINDFYVKKDGLGIIIPTYNSMGYILIEGRPE